PPAARSRSQSTYPRPASRQTSPDSAPSQTSPREDSQTPVLPADSPHTAIRIVVPPGTGRSHAPTEYSAPPYAPPARRPLPPPPPPAPAALPAPPASSPASHSSALADAADCSGTSPRKSFRPSSASSAPAPLPAS